MSETSTAVRQSSTVQSCFETFQFDSVAGSTRATCLYGESDYRWPEPRLLETFDSEKFRNSSNPIFGWNAQIAVIRESGEWVIVKTFGQMKTLAN
jgi:hypothetical protein